MNILLIHDLQKKDGNFFYNAVNYYRMQKPLQVLHRMYPDVDFITADSPKVVPDHIKAQTDLVLFSRTIPEGARELFGCPIGLDLDDYWYLEPDHLLYNAYKEHKVPELVIRSIKDADFVTCTTEILANEIAKHNPNVYILPNGIDTEDVSWQPNKIKSNRVRFGFTQGETHFPDIKMVAPDVARSFNDTRFYKGAQVVLTGFRFQTEYKNGRVGRHSIQIGYESILTNGLKVLKHKPDYLKDLCNGLCPDGDAPYKRIESVPAIKFGNVYDHIDVSVAPLKANLFNSCKSNIKMLEAGFKDCAIMVSAVAPYLPLATKDNSFLLSEKNFFEWQRYILLNPEIVKDKKSQLKEDVKPYALNLLTHNRKNVYEKHTKVLNNGVI